MSEGDGRGATDETVPEALVARMTDAFIGLDADGRVTYLNETAKSILGEAFDDPSVSERLDGEVLWEALPHGRETTLYDRFDGAMERQQPDSYEDYYPPLDAWFEVTLHPSDSGLTVYFRDVTERRERQERLRRRESALRELYETVADPDMSFEQRVDELLATGQDVLATDYGTLSRVDGETYHFEFVRGEDDAVVAGDSIDVDQTYCDRIVETEGSLKFGDVTTERPECTDRAGFTELGISCYIGTPVTVDGDFYGTLCFYDTEPRDRFNEWEQTLVDLMGRWVSTALERKLTAERLERQNDRLEQFAEILSHDLRNPIQVVRGNVQLARNEQESEALRRAADAASRMDRMVTDVLEMTVAGESVEETEAVDLPNAAADAWESVDADRLALAVPADSTVQADRDRLVRVFENLFHNCALHTAGGVTVSVEDTETGFAVADDGQGMDPDDRERAFEHGYSDSTEGTGFGLSIVDEVASAHGWTVSLAESSDGGMRVEFGGVR